jgi:hypothetical protein
MRRFQCDGGLGIFPSRIAACHANVAMTMADCFRSPRRAEVLQRREPAIEDGFGFLVLFQVEAECSAASGIVVQVDGELIPSRRGFAVLRDVGAGAEQPLRPPGPAWSGIDRAVVSHDDPLLNRSR